MTKVISKKDFEIKTGINLDSSKTVYVDETNRFKIKGQNSIYPAVFTLNDSLVVTNVQFEKPGNGILNLLGKRLDQ